LGLALLAFASARARVVLGRDGVRIVNHYVTKAIPWSEFDGFVVRRAYLRLYRGYVARWDGRFVGASVLETRGVLGGSDRELDLVVDQLNQMAMSFQRT
jgi:hypothetical protein